MNTGEQGHASERPVTPEHIALDSAIIATVRQRVGVQNAVKFIEEAVQAALDKQA